MDLMLLTLKLVLININLDGTSHVGRAHHMTLGLSKKAGKSVLEEHRGGEDRGLRCSLSLTINLLLHTTTLLGLLDLLVVTLLNSLKSNGGLTKSLASIIDLLIKSGNLLRLTSQE